MKASVFADDLPVMEVPITAFHSSFNSAHQLQWGNDLTVQHRRLPDCHVYDLQLKGKRLSTMRFSIPEGAFVLHFSLDGPLEYELAGLQRCVVHERGFCLYYVPALHGKVYTGLFDNRSIVITLPPSALEPYAYFFSTAAAFMEQVNAKRAAMLSRFPQPAPYELLTDLEQAIHHPAKLTAASLLETVIDKALRQLLVVPVVKPLFLHEDQLQQVYIAREIIRKNINRHLAPAEIDQATGLSDWKRRSWFPMVFGVGMGEYATQYRMELARQMLLSGKKTAYIARKLGYACADTFRHTFRRYFGLIPSAFLQDIRRASPASEMVA